MVAVSEFPINPNASALDMANAIFSAGVTGLCRYFTGSSFSTGICSNGDTAKMQCVSASNEHPEFANSVHHDFAAVRTRASLVPLMTSDGGPAVGNLNAGAPEVSLASKDRASDQPVCRTERFSPGRKTSAASGSGMVTENCCIFPELGPATAENCSPADGRSKDVLR